MSDINLPGAPEDARAGDDKAALAHGAAIDEGRRVARNENEDFSGVAEAIIANGKPGDDIGGDVIEKNQPERQTPKQIKPQVAFGLHSQGNDFGITRRSLGWTSARGLWLFPLGFRLL